MNSKHLAAIVVALLAILLIQGSLEVRKRLVGIRNQLAEAQTAASGVELLLNAEKGTLESLRANSAELIAFLEEWNAALSAIDSPEAGELNISSRVKQANLVTLSQRFEVVATENNETIPKVVRAHLTFEDSHVKTLNWLGSVEKEVPSSRVASLKIVRGETGDDIRMDLVIDVPLLNKELSK